MIKIIKSGISRNVILLGKYAIKFPNIRYSHTYFLLGCYANSLERKYTIEWKGCEDWNGYGKISPTLFCSWYGLFSIQYRVSILDRELSEDEKIYFEDVCTDIKPDNFGYLNNKVVCVDYH